MDTKKIIPIILTALLVIAGITIYSKNKVKNRGYEHLIVNYNGTQKEYNIVSGTKITEVAAEIVSTEGNKIVVRDYQGNDIEIKLNNEKQVCKTTSDCATLVLK